MIRRAAASILCVLSVACGSKDSTPTDPSDPSSPPQANAGQVLVRDDFEAAALDTSVWLTPEGPGTFFGRTQIRPPSEPPKTSGGALHLAVDTFNPTALRPGDSFWGS